jgi:hypothetical protein
MQFLKKIYFEKLNYLNSKSSICYKVNVISETLVKFIKKTNAN